MSAQQLGAGDSSLSRQVWRGGRERQGFSTLTAVLSGEEPARGAQGPALALLIRPTALQPHPQVGHVLLSRQVVSSRARQTWCPWHCCGFASCQVEGKVAQAGETPAPPCDGTSRGPHAATCHTAATRSQGIPECRVLHPPGEAGAEPRNQCVCCFPTLNLWAGLALRPPGAGPASGSWAPAFAFMQRPPPCASGSRVVTSGSSAWALSCPGPASDRPSSPVPSLPLLPSHPSSSHPRAHSPHSICPLPLTSPDSAAVCPGPASRPPPWPPPGSPPGGRGRLLGKAVIFPAGDYRFGAEGV